MSWTTIHSDFVSCCYSCHSLWSGHICFLAITHCHPLPPQGLCMSCPPLGMMFSEIFTQPTPSRPQVFASHSQVLTSLFNTVTHSLLVFTPPSTYNFLICSTVSFFVITLKTSNILYNLPMYCIYCLLLPTPTRL